MLLTFICGIFTFFSSFLLPKFVPRLSFAAGFLGGLVSGFLIKSAYSLNLVQLGCLPGVGEGARLWAITVQFVNKRFAQPLARLST